MKSVTVSILMVTLTLLSTMTGAVASEQDGQWYVTGMATYIDPSAERGLSDEFAGGQIGLGRAISKAWNIEIEIDYLDVDNKKDTTNTEFLGGAVNGMRMWNRAGMVTPYLLAGIGAVNIDTAGVSDSTEFQFQVGPGILIDFTERLALRAEVLGRWADESDLLANIGLQFAFGKKRGVPVAAAAIAAPRDSDGDGVMDGDDNCPGTPAGAVVDANGCGIDSDGDGFLDGIDECPNTIQGALIDDVGCGYQLTGAHFGFDSDELTYDGELVLDKVADRMELRPGFNLTIEGYTDNRGDPDYNVDLSLRRAQSAKDYLVDQGVASNRLTAVGLGEAYPVASNDTEEGRAANRRVVLKVND